MWSRLRNFNWVSFGAMLALIALGTLAIWSAGSARSEAFHGMWKANLTTAVFGLAVYFVLAWTDYRRLLDWGAAPAYFGALVLLILVLLVGSEVYGGKRWLWFFQPGEIAKLALLMALAQVYGRLDFTFGSRTCDLGGLTGFLLAVVLVGLPCLLILMEPDLGTTLALIPSVVVLLLSAGVWRKGFAVLLALGGLAALLLLGAVNEAEKPGASEAVRARIHYFVGGDDPTAARFVLAPLKPHQYRRVKTFLHPDKDRTGAGWNRAQAQISIGTGGWSGKGFCRGENNRLKFLPASVSMNDFIFCVYAEETGYRGSLILLGLFLTLCGTGVWTAWRAVDMRGRLLALGVTTLIFAHVFINIAMSIGLLPITGLPLPFISSGRTFLVVVMSGLGLIQSVSMHREEIR
ncbi:MAG: FtsW/RodA/SpoVE family cell cycle protein [Kiritimatiellia bacterium]